MQNYKTVNLESRPVLNPDSLSRYVFSASHELKGKRGKMMKFYASSPKGAGGIMFSGCPSVRQYTLDIG